jgi:aminoglycoside phosphotransferase (APT) family kinase protein
LTAAPTAGDIGPMRLIDELSAEDYLRGAGRVAPQERLSVRELSGGVSNMVLLVERPNLPGADFVLKQARAQLRTRHEWHCGVERIWREAEVLALCQRVLSMAPANGPARFSVGTPQILFEDRPNYVLAMTAAPRPNSTWKQELLAGRTDAAIAAACGRLMGTLHAQTWLDGEIASRIGDRTLFDQLRIDPYYRTLAATRSQTAAAIRGLIASLEAHPRSLVHADFSPKNLLVFEGGLMMVDFETGHYGDPAFDLGFFLSHLVLKACHRIPRHADYLALSETFREAYDAIVGPKIGSAEQAGLWARGIQNFAACAWARLDGKSPVDYLSDPVRRDLVRGLCGEIFESPLRDWSQVVRLCDQRFAVSGAAGAHAWAEGPPS